MNFRIWINDCEHTITPVRVSKYPINRVWGGKQRNVSQTEISYFTGFDIIKTAKIRILVLDCAVDKVEIRPLKKNIPFTVNGNEICFELNCAGQFTVEVNGYHECLAIFADPPFEYDKRENDICFAAGVHHAGLIVPKSNSRIIIERGAVVYGAIYAKDCENLEIIGRGILDCSCYRRSNDDNGGDGHEISDALRKLDITERDVFYSGMFNAYNCKNLKVEGITFIDSPFWTFIIRNGCENVVIDNIKIIGQWRYNSDGVDICNSSDVVLKNSFVRSFDDCVVVRAPHLDGEHGGCHNVLIKNNTLWCDWGKNLEIWSGCIDSHIHNVVFEDNYLIRVQGKAISIDTWFGSDSITVSDIEYNGVYVEHDKDHLPMQYNEDDNAEYDFSLKDDNSGVQLVYIGVMKLGKNLGNQQFDENIDVSEFDIRYKNICINNLESTMDFPNAYSIKSDKLSELSGITINGIDYKEYIKE